MKTLLTRFARDESGATVIEYALIASLVSAAIVFALMSLGAQLGETFDGVAAGFP